MPHWCLLACSAMSVLLSTGSRRPKCRQLRSLWPRGSDASGSGLLRRAVYTSSYGARLSSVPSGDRSVNPTTPRCFRAQFSVSTQKRSGSGRLTSSKEVIRAANLVIPCWSSTSGQLSKYTRSQSWETDSLIRPSGSMKTSAKRVSMGPAHWRKRLQNLIRFSPASIQGGFSHSGGPRAGSGYGTRSRHSLE